MISPSAREWVIASNMRNRHCNQHCNRPSTGALFGAQFARSGGTPKRITAFRRHRLRGAKGGGLNFLSINAEWRLGTCA